MMLSATIGRGTVADYVEAVFIVYFILIFVRILLTWVPRIPYNRGLRAAIGFIQEVTDPYLNVFRRVIPPLGRGGFALDLSPMLAMILLYVVGAIVVGAHPRVSSAAWAGALDAWRRALVVCGVVVLVDQASKASSSRRSPSASSERVAAGLQAREHPERRARVRDRERARRSCSL